MIRFKSINVRIDLAHPAMQRLLITLAHLDRAHETLGRTHYTGDLVVTSGNDSRHGEFSRHYSSEAIDIRSHNFLSRARKRDFRLWYEADLGAQFRVLLEAEGTPNEHFHAQVRKGLIFDVTAL